MRLTVHVEGAKKESYEKKNADGVLLKRTRTMNTLSYEVSDKDEAATVLAGIESNGLGTPTKHYLSNSKITGFSRGKKKS